MFYRNLAVTLIALVLIFSIYKICSICLSIGPENVRCGPPQVDIAIIRGGARRQNWTFTWPNIPFLIAEEIVGRSAAPRRLLCEKPPILSKITSGSSRQVFFGELAPACRPSAASLGFHYLPMPRPLPFPSQRTLLASSPPIVPFTTKPRPPPPSSPAPPSLAPILSPGRCFLVPYLGPPSQAPAGATSSTTVALRLKAPATTTSVHPPPYLPPQIPSSFFLHHHRRCAP